MTTCLPTCLSVSISFSVSLCLSVCLFMGAVLYRITSHSQTRGEGKWEASTAWRRRDRGKNRAKRRRNVKVEIEKRKTEIKMINQAKKDRQGSRPKILTTFFSSISKIVFSP